MRGIGPEEDRLREFATTNLPALEQELYSEAPLPDSLQILKLTIALRNMRTLLGTGNPVVKEVLAKQTPEELAKAIVTKSKIKLVDFRKQMATGAAATSDDPALQLARLLDKPSRDYRKEFEETDQPILHEASSKIAQARFAAYGSTTYPDATSSYRIGFGDVRGYTNAAGYQIPWATTFEGLYKRATAIEPLALPDEWLQAKGKLHLKTPFNFVTTADIHGGSSGSPTVNSKGELVGIVFDSNLEGLPNRYVFTDEQARAVHVASQAIVEALKVVFGATELLKELGM